MQKVTALIMARRRLREINPIAEAAGVSPKCIVPIEDRLLIEQVLEDVLASDYVGQIAISIGDQDVMRALSALAAHLASGKIRLLRAVDQLGDAAWSLLITTADSVLQTAGMVGCYTDKMRASPGHVFFAMTSVECGAVKPC